MLRYISIKKWSSIKINLTYEIFSKCYVIYINRLKGDRNSFVHIAYKLNQDLKKIRDNMLWDLRKNYLLLLEGLPVETGRHNILNYLFNDGILMEVCAFMSK
jgi:hypothetical protein